MLCSQSRAQGSNLIALAVIAGIIAGAVSLVPLFAGLHATRRMEAQESAAGYLTPMLIALAGSFLILVLATLICVLAARPFVAPFAIAEAATLVIGALGFGIVRIVSK